MAPPKQKAASYELIETGGGEGYGSVEPASADSTNEEYDKYDGGETPRRKLLSLVAPASATGKFLFVGPRRSARERPLLRTVSLPAPRPAIQDDNDLIYRPAPAEVEQVVELHDDEEE